MYKFSYYSTLESEKRKKNKGQLSFPWSLQIFLLLFSNYNDHSIT